MVSFKVITPATCANLGPGFDTLGLAINIYNTYTINTSNTYRISGCPQEFQNENNLFIIAYKQTCDYMHKQVTPINVNIDANIPVSSGLGSSAACIVAGILAANHIHGDKLSIKELANIATNIEGHPDNVVPCLLGNLCSSFIDGKIIINKHTVNENLNIIIFKPNYKLSTSEARKVLPTTINYHDAIYNIARIPALLEGFKNANHELLKASLKDKLHEPYRKPLLKDFYIIKQLTKDFTSLNISGAGPALIGIYKHADINYIANNLPSTYTITQVKIDQKGAYIINNE